MTLKAHDPIPGVPGLSRRQSDGRYVFHRTLEGVRVQVVFRTTSLEAAKRAVALAELDPEAFIRRRQERARARVRFSVGSAAFLGWSETTKQNVPAYRVRQAGVLRSLEFDGPENLAAWKPAHVEAFVRRRGAEVSRSTVEGEVKIVRAFFGFAVSRKWIKESPAKGVASPKPLLGSTDARAVVPFERLAQIGASPEVTAALVVLWGTGLRAGEFAALEASDVHPADGRLRVRPSTAKSRKARDVPVSDPAVVEALKVALEAKGRLGAPAYLRSLQRAIDLGCKRAGLPRFTLKALRHSFGSRCADAGVPVTVVKEWMGHSSVLVTEKYYLHAIRGWTPPPAVPHNQSHDFACRSAAP